MPPCLPFQVGSTTMNLSPMLRFSPALKVGSSEHKRASKHSSEEIVTAKSKQSLKEAPDAHVILLIT